MCDSPELLSALAKLTKVVEQQTLKRDYNDQTYAVSDTQGFILDYKGYRYLFVYSGTALTFLLGSTSYPIAANTWTSLAYKEGYKIFTTGQATPVNVRVRATDDVLALLTVGGGGGGGLVTQGTNPWVVSGSVTQDTSPWIVQVSNVNANGQQPMTGSSPVVLASDEVVPVSAATGGIVDLLTLLNALAIAQGTALGANTGPMMQGSVATNGPTYVNGQISPFSISTNGSLRVQSNISGSGVVGNVGTINAQTQRIVQATDATGTQTSVASSATSTTILASNTGRVQAIIFNDSTQILYLLFVTGGTASLTVFSVPVAAQGYFELPGPTVYNGAIIGIWAAANGNARVTEFS